MLRTVSGEPAVSNAAADAQMLKLIRRSSSSRCGVVSYRRTPKSAFCHLPFNHGTIRFLDVSKHLPFRQKMRFPFFNIPIRPQPSKEFLTMELKLFGSLANHSLL
jgi:hypothetical protein